MSSLAKVAVGKTDPIERGLRLVRTAQQHPLTFVGKTDPIERGLRLDFMRIVPEYRVGKTDPIERGLRHHQNHKLPHIRPLEKQTR